MTYKKFPFGKYAGKPMNELDSTYIVHALETFDLSEDLKADLLSILDFRFGIIKNNVHINNLIYLNESWDANRNSVTKLDYHRSVWNPNKYLKEVSNV